MKVKRVKLMDLVDYSDEVGENYDFEAWLEDDAEEKSLSIMELHGSIEETCEKAYIK